MKYTYILVFNRNFYHYYQYLFYSNKSFYLTSSPQVLKHMQSFWVKRISKEIKTNQLKNFSNYACFSLNEKLKLRLKYASLLINRSMSNKNNINFKQVHKILFLKKTFIFKNYVLLLNLIPNFYNNLKVSYYYILTHIRFLKHLPYGNITKMFYYANRVTKTHTGFRNTWHVNLSLL